ncbi:MAG TPA: S53 family peptidase [Candidatus Baltobacteraceae bacterium]|jgi:subtilase family serine protease
MAAIICCAIVSGCAGSRVIPATAVADQSRFAAEPFQEAPRSIAAVPAFHGIHLTDLGAAPSSATLKLAITLRYRNEARLDDLIRSQITPGSGQFHRWLSNAQFKAAFAPSARDYKSVLNTMTRSGLTIDRTYDNRTVIDVTGSVAAIDRLFRTSIHRVSQRGHAEQFINVRPARAPEALKSVILSVDGLNTTDELRPEYVLPTHASEPLPQTHGGRSGLFGPVSKQTGMAGYAPRAFWRAYDLPINHRSPSGKRYDGSGRTSGILINGDPSASDIGAFLRYFGIARNGPPTKVVLVDTKVPPQATVESVLDAETILGNAPGTALYIYEVPKLSYAPVTDAYNQVVSDNAVDTLNSSFGVYEQDAGNAPLTWNEIAKQGAAKGITFHAASGDFSGLVAPSAPADCPYFVSVGGTSLSIGARGTWAYETGWSGTGGGVSGLFAQPPWQRNVAGTIDRGRNSPDVSFDGDPASGTALYIFGTWNSTANPVGGTSLSSPIFGALITELDQMNNGRLGLPSAKIYSIWKRRGYGTIEKPLFHDITQGCSGIYCAGRGYDLVTGIGSIDGTNLSRFL